MKALNSVYQRYLDNPQATVKMVLFTFSIFLFIIGAGAPEGGGGDYN